MPYFRRTITFTSHQMTSGSYYVASDEQSFVLSLENSPSEIDQRLKSTMHGLSAMALLTNDRTQMTTYQSLSTNVQVQSSIVTIFSIWNTMMGVSLLSMPWGLYQAGFTVGIALLIIIGAITFYTAYLVVSSKNKMDPTEPMVYEFSDICRSLFGRYGELVSVIFSIVILIGAVLVYWVLLSNFLYFTGILLYGMVGSTDFLSGDGDNETCHVHCGMETDSLPMTNHNASSIIFGLTFTDIWHLKLTVPIYLAVLMFPLLNFKSPTFFTKFTMLGTISVIYLISFNITQLVKCGVHMDFSNVASPHYVEHFNFNFAALTGMLTMSYMIHNGILTILRCQQHPENNARDLCVGYILTGFCYIFIAITFYMSFPLSRSCIEDNLLNNFDIDYLLSSVARVLLFVQLFAIYPLLVFLIRSQISCLLYNRPWPGRVFVLLLNAAIVSMGVFAAMFFPNVGAIVRYFGAFSGLVMVYALPCLVYMKQSYCASQLAVPKFLFHLLIIFLGVMNLIAQFVL